jgi:hypothetical protein
MKVILVGGHPKGYPEPFDERTLSGHRLRGIVKELGLDAEYFDLWENESQERDGRITQETHYFLMRAASDGQIIALGKRVKESLELYGFEGLGEGFITLPHPAARRKQDLEVLKDGLSKFKSSSAQTIEKEQGAE